MRVLVCGGAGYIGSNMRLTPAAERNGLASRIYKPELVTIIKGR